MTYDYAMGPLLLTLAAVFATTAFLTGWFNANYQRLLQRASISFLALAVARVLWLLVTENTSFAIVVESTRPGLHPIRRAMGLWGSSSGSLLFFTLVIGGVLVAVPVVDRLRGAPSLVLAALTWTSLVAESPFEQLDAPAIAGSGLSPILEHWAMIIHPPLLYLGLALSLVPAIVEPRNSRRWSAAAIATLTFSLALGSNWAYEELGWGGWYAWDPVENVALIPWLLLVGGMHANPRHLAFRYTAIVTWPTVFAGTAMTRTSLRTSVHAFANNDQLGLTLWPLAVATTLGGFAYALSIRGSRSASLPLNSLSVTRRWPVVLITFTAVVVALGTFRPFIPGDGTAGTFYTRYLYPVAIVGLIAMGLAPRWKDKQQRVLVMLLCVGALVGATAAFVSGWTTWWQIGLAGALAGSLTATIGPGIFPLPRTLAHIGLICVLAGALGGTASTTRNLLLDPGESVAVDGHTITNGGVSFAEGPPPIISADMTIDGTTARPEVAVFVERGLRLPEVATHRGFLEDVQLILRNADDDGGVQVTVNVEPLTQFVWFGAALISISFLMTATKKRRTQTAESLSTVLATPRLE